MSDHPPIYPDEHGDWAAANRPLTYGKHECLDTSPPWFTGRWRDWHRGHGCRLDDGKARSADAVAEIAARRGQPPSADARLTPMAEGKASGSATESDLRDLRTQIASLTEAREGLQAERDDLAQQLDVLRPGGLYAWKSKYEALTAVHERLSEILIWLDRRGGLGLDVHQRIQAALVSLDEPVSVPAVREDSQ